MSTTTTHECDKSCKDDVTERSEPLTETVHELSTLSTSAEAPPLVCGQLTKECPICFRDVDIMSTCYLACCGLEICIQCCDTWFLKNGMVTRETCPTCRTPHYTDVQRTAFLLKHLKPWAYYELAQSYMSGDGVPRSSEEAFRHMVLAEQGGEVRAFVQLGIFYQQGFGVSQSDEKAIECYKKGSNAGIGICSYNLGMLYMNRNDVVNMEHYLRLAVHQKSIPAYHVLGKCHLYGNYGIANDESKGIELLTMACDEGYRMSELTLGVYFFQTKQSVKSLDYLKASLDEKKQRKEYNLCYDLSPDYNEAMFYTACSFMDMGHVYHSYYWFKKFCMVSGESQMRRDAKLGMESIEKATAGCCSNDNCDRVKTPGGTPLMICTGCRLAHFCNKECQRSDWAEHKEICKALKGLQ